MVQFNDEVVTMLHKLTEICHDAEEGFRHAAEGVDDSSLQLLFQECSNQRARFASELNDEVVEFGAKPESGGTMSGTLHHGWMKIKTAVSGNDEKAVISECERGEDVAVRAYQDALNKELPSDVRKVVEKQYGEVVKTHNHIRSLELKFRKKATHKKSKNEEIG